MVAVVSEIGKWCSGPAHEAPAYLPPTEEFWYFYQSGPKKGLPHSWCKACFRWNGMYDSQMVECKVILPFVRELVLRCGSRELAARYAEIGVSTIYKITSYGQCYVQKPTAQKLLLAIDRKRREDRKNGHTPKKFLEQRITAAKLEDRMIAQAGRYEIPEPPPSPYYEE